MENNAAIDLVIKSAEEKVNSIEDPLAKQGAQVGLQILKDHKDDVKHLAKDALKSVVADLSIGNVNSAMETFIAKTEDVDSLISGVEASGEVFKNADEAHRERTRKFDNVAKRISAEVGRFLLPIIFGA